jgi:hypothetical protein
MLYSLMHMGHNLLISDNLNQSYFEHPVHYSTKIPTSKSCAEKPDATATAYQTYPIKSCQVCYQLLNPLMFFAMGISNIP